MTLAITSASGAATPSPVAHAASGPAYGLSFSPNVIKYSSGLTMNLVSATQPSSVLVSLPAGTAVNPAAVPVCTTIPQCEPSTEVGSGSATVAYSSYIIPLNFLVYNRPAGIAIVITNPSGAPIVVLATLSGTTLTIPYPNGSYKGLPIVIQKLSLTFNDTGSGAKAYVHNPAACPASGWTSNATFTFSDGTTQTASTSAKCALKPKPKPKPKPKKKKKKK